MTHCDFIRRRFEAGTLPAERAGSCAQPLSEINRSEGEQRLRRALAELDELQLDVIQRRIIQGCSWAEIARDLELPTADDARRVFALSKQDLVRALDNLDE